MYAIMDRGLWKVTLSRDNPVTWRKMKTSCHGRQFWFLVKKTDLRDSNAHEPRVVEFNSKHTDQIQKPRNGASRHYFSTGAKFR